MRDKGICLCAIKSIIASIVFIGCCVQPVAAQHESLRMAIQKLIAATDADAGVALAFNNNPSDTLSLNGARHYPMQSVFKFHIALAVLHNVDKGKWKLDQKIRIEKSDLMTNTWSPIQKKYPEGNISLTLEEILWYTVSQSDNNGCDILLRMLGGPIQAEQFIHSLGVANVAIRFNEKEMHKEWNIQFSNWTTPRAMVVLLEKFQNGNILSDSSSRFLMKAMIDTPTGLKRLKGDLPAGTVVAHKTGTSGSGEDGIIAAVNDSGIILLPDGQFLAISVFVSNTRAPMVESEKLIAGIAKLAWDEFSAR